MNKDEEKLDRASRLVADLETQKKPPVFELFITMFSIFMAISLLWFPNLLGYAVAHQWLLMIMPQHIWALVFLGAGLLKVYGLVRSRNIGRFMGLIVSILIYSTFAVCYTISFLTVGSVVFTSITIFTVISLPMVSHTSLKVD